MQENTEDMESKGSDEAHGSLSPPQRAPWLVFFSHGKQQKLCTFVSLAEEKVYVSEQEEMCRSHCYGCCGGWLFMMDLSQRDCSLLNLLSGEKIMLPPPPQGSSSICGAVVTSPPAKGRNSMILAYLRDRHGFLFHRLKEDKWDLVKHESEDIVSLLNCNGTIYALVGREGELAIIDVVPYPEVRPLHVQTPPYAYDMVANEQLLESCGELFLIRWLTMMFTRKLYKFEVFKMDFSEMKWVEVSSLGDRAFFSGEGLCHGISCSASRAGIAANCIYFVGLGHNSISKFDMADETVSTEMSWPSMPEPSEHVAWIDMLED